MSYAIVGTLSGSHITPDPGGSPILVGRYQGGIKQRFSVACPDGKTRYVEKKQAFPSAAVAARFGAQEVQIDAVPNGQRVASEALVNDGGVPRLQRTFEAIAVTEGSLTGLQWRALLRALPAGARGQLRSAIQTAGARPETPENEAALVSADYLTADSQKDYGTVLLALANVGITGVEQQLADRWQAALAAGV